MVSLARTSRSKKDRPPERPADHPSGANQRPDTNPETNPDTETETGADADLDRAPAGFDPAALPAIHAARRHEVALTGGVVATDMIPAAVEAALLTSDKPLGPTRILQALGLDESKITKAALHDIVAALNDEYRITARSFEIAEVAGGWRLMTRPELAAPVAAIQGIRDSGKLSKPALETLAIIAYKQPITRAQIEAIRGVACGEVLKTLIERRLVAIVGRAEELGRPMLYGTTRQFLEAFGLTAVRDLPTVADVLAPPDLAPPDPDAPEDPTPIAADTAQPIAPTPDNHTPHNHTPDNHDPETEQPHPGSNEQ